MGNIIRQTKSEFRQLPFMLGKLLGGIMTALGFTIAVVIMTRKYNVSVENILPPLLVASTGIAIFLLSGRRLTKRLAIDSQETLSVKKNRISILSWLLLIIFAGIFLIWVYFVTV
jgi:hypothetical protein